MARYFRNPDISQRKIDKDIDIGEIPTCQRRSLPKLLDYYAERFADRDRAIQAAYESGGYTMKTLATYFGLHYTSISRIINGQYFAK